MCGVLPVVVMLQAARQLGATMAELIDYRNGRSPNKQVNYQRLCTEC